MLNVNLLLKRAVHDDDDDDGDGDYDDADGVHGGMRRRGSGWGREMLGGEGGGVMGVNCNAGAR